MDTVHLIITLLTLAGIVVLMAGNFLRNDLAAALSIPVLTISGVLELPEALSGFSSPVIIIIACMYVVGEGLIHTGVTQRAGELIIRRGGSSETKILLLIMLTAALVGSVMSSSATVAIFIPITLAVAEKTGLNHKRLLIPLAAAALISGMMTLVATTPNIIVNEILRSRGYSPLSFFSFTPFGLTNLILAVIFMILFGQNMLAKKHDAVPRKKEPSINDLLRHYRIDNYEYLLRVTPQSDLLTRSVAMAQLGLQHHVTLLAVRTSNKGLKKRVVPVQPEMVFRPGDLLLLIGSPTRVSDFAEHFALESVQETSLATQLKAFFQVIGIAELMLHPDSTLIGKTLKETQFRSAYHGLVLGIRRKGVALTEDVSDILLKPGDVLLVCGAWQELLHLSQVREQCLLLTLPRDYKEVIPAKHKEKITLGVLAAMVVTMIFTPVPPVIAIFAATCALLLTRCVPINSVYRVIDWQTLVMIAGILPLALALQKTGVVTYVASGFLLLFEHTGVLVSLGGLFLVAALLGLIMNTTATAILLAPMAMDIASGLGISPQACAMVLAIACSSAFISPFGSTIPMLVREPGGYGPADYAKTGLPMLLLCMLATVLLARLLFS